MSSHFNPSNALNPQPDLHPQHDETRTTPTMTSPHRSRPTPVAERPENDSTAPKALWRWVAGAVCIAIVGMWVYIFAARPDVRPADRLQDRAFARSAESACAKALADVQRLPNASEATSPQDRSVTIVAANRRLDSLLTELVGLRVTPASEKNWVNRWLADWRVYLEDRRDYAAELATGADVQFKVSGKNGTQITRGIDAFAEVNDMPSCQHPPDV